MKNELVYNSKTGRVSNKPVKKTTEQKIKELKKSLSKWELIQFECKMMQKYNLKTA